MIIYISYDTKHSVTLTEEDPIMCQQMAQLIYLMFIEGLLS